MGNDHNRDDKQSDEAPHSNSLPTRTIYAAVVGVVLTSIVSTLTMFIRNPVDEIDELKQEFREHIKECDTRLDKIEREHVLYDFRLNSPFDKKRTHDRHQ